MTRVRKAQIGETAPAVKSATRRAVLEKAAKILGKQARHKAFVRTYARMNPSAQLTYNAFYFGEDRKPPRCVIFGPWVYIHAPGIKLPREAATLTDNDRRRRHLGALHARMHLGIEDDLRVVADVAERLARVTSPRRGA